MVVLLENIAIYGHSKNWDVFALEKLQMERFIDMNALDVF